MEPLSTPSILLPAIELIRRSTDYFRSLCETPLTSLDSSSHQWVSQVEDRLLEADVWNSFQSSSRHWRVVVRDFGLAPTPFELPAKNDKTYISRIHFKKILLQPLVAILNCILLFFLYTFLLSFIS